MREDTLSPATDAALARNVECHGSQRETVSRVSSTRTRRLLEIPCCYVPIVTVAADCRQNPVDGRSWVVEEQIFEAKNYGRGILVCSWGLWAGGVGWQLAAHPAFSEWVCSSVWAPRFQPRARKGKTPLERSANADMKTQFNACQPNLELRELKYELKTTCRPSSALPTDLPMPLCTSGQLVLIRPLNTKLHLTNLIPRSMHPDTRLFSLTRFRCNPHTFPSLLTQLRNTPKSPTQGNPFTKPHLPTRNQNPKISSLPSPPTWKPTPANPQTHNIHPNPPPPPAEEENPSHRLP